MREEMDLKLGPRRENKGVDIGEVKKTGGREELGI
jgi:hypothetical protein